MKKKKILLIPILGAVGLFAYSQFKTSPKKASNDLFDDVPAVQVKQEAPAVVTPPPQENKPVVVAQAQPKNGYLRSVKSISRDVAIEQYKLTNYYESIVSEVEGFRASLYNDNTGLAVGNGWNVSLQSKAMNTAITSEIGLPSEQAQSLIALSGILKTASYPKVSITPAQATKAAQVMRIKAFEPVAIKGIGKEYFDMLTPNQQAVVVYHAYKTGNWAKWPKLKADVIQCAKTHSRIDCEKAGAGFTYSYMMNGTRMYDKRSNLYMNALFVNPEDYGYLLGINKATDNFQNVAKASTMVIDTSKKADEQIEKQDDFGKEKERLIENGIPFSNEVIIPQSQVITQKPASKPRGHLPMGYMG